ncbi:alpha/beta hydrolase [Microbacterium sp. NPDC057650]|uniref:alpha/beta hydrolase n=1 Tax=unclassified Microbacterium TaxID=2609290 RepID=UPI00366EDDE8
MHFTSEHPLEDDVLERDFLLGDIPGILWTPPVASADEPVPLILLGHPGGITRMRARLRGRAQASAGQGFASATIELPGTGERPGIPTVDQARTDLRQALAAGQTITDDIVDRLILPLVDQGVPELQALLDALLAEPELREPAAYSGGVISIGVRLAVVEPRIVAAGLFAGSYVPRSIMSEARGVTIPLHVLLQWDDEGNDRQMALDLFDAFGSEEKALLANTGGHTGVPASAGPHAAAFYARHLLG